MAATTVINGVHYELKYDQQTGHFEWIPATTATPSPAPVSEWKVGDRFRFTSDLVVPAGYRGRIGRIVEVGLHNDTAFRFELEDRTPLLFGRTVWYKTAAVACERLSSVATTAEPQERTCTNKWCARRCDVGRSCWHCGAEEVCSVG